jgi:hypothetical protein
MFAARGGKRLVALQSHRMYAENVSLGEEYCREVSGARNWQRTHSQGADETGGLLIALNDRVCRDRICTHAQPCRSGLLADLVSVKFSHRSFESVYGQVGQKNQLHLPASLSTMSGLPD